MSPFFIILLRRRSLGKVFVLFDSPMFAINGESVDPDILPKGSPGREWVAYEKLPEQYPDLGTLYTPDFRLHISKNADAEVEKLRRMLR